MFDRQSIHIAMLLWGCIFNLIAALCMFMSKNFDRKKRKYMLLMELACAVLLFSDALAWAFRGMQGISGYWMVRISNFFVFLFSDIMLLFFHGYACSCLFEENHPKKKKFYREKAVIWISLAGMVMVAVSQFTNLYYHFDSRNFYHRNPAYVISVLIPVAGMLIDLSLLIQYHKKISHRLFISMLSYIMLPFCAAWIQIFYYGISLTNIAISISLILMFVVAMMEQNEKLARKEKEAADLRISLMLSQIAPHFIYNALTAIQHLCEKDPAMAKETVGEFAGYLRGNLESLSEDNTIPFERELEHVQCYLAIEKKRFGDRVNIRYDIQTEDFNLPALTLQPLVENAVKHGLCKKTGGGTLTISTEEKQDAVYITVEDDGTGFDLQQMINDGEVHIGLKSVKSRLESMCSGKLYIESIPGKGTKAVIGLPRNK